MENYTLITGGTSGLGKELALLFGKDGNNLLLVSSNKERLEKTKKELEEKLDVDIKILAVDLSDPSKFHEVTDYTNSNDIFVKNLVNCAGFGDCTDFVDMDIEKQIKMTELNCNALLYLTHEYVKPMLKENCGQILNISSIAAFMPGPYMVTYHATKAYVLLLSEGISRELKGTNVKLTTICPGPFDSNFVKVAHNDYAFSKIKPITSEKVAKISYKAFKKKKYIKIIGGGNKLMVFALRFFPRKFVTNISAKTMKKGA